VHPGGHAGFGDRDREAARRGVAAILCRVDWFFTALLVIIAGAAAGLTGLAAHRLLAGLRP
jgi:hypothetical protein